MSSQKQPRDMKAHKKGLTHEEPCRSSRCCSRVYRYRTGRCDDVRHSCPAGCKCLTCIRAQTPLGRTSLYGQPWFLCNTKNSDARELRAGMNPNVVSTLFVRLYHRVHPLWLYREVQTDEIYAAYNSVRKSLAMKYNRI